jgi:hypothetical protein
MRRLTLISLVMMATVGWLNGQTLEELEALKKAKKDSISSLEKDLKNIQKQIDAFPGWETGAYGTIGLNIANFNNWFQKKVPNSAGGAIGITINGHANFDNPTHFWRNAGVLNLGWVKFDDQDDPDDENGYQVATDIFNLSSLYGRKIGNKLAASGRMEYRSSILNNFNDPGYLDLGIGFTWDPAKGLFVTFHPLNGNLVFADQESIFESTFGSKIVAEYSRDISGGLSFTSNFSGFLSYRSINRSNWTWNTSVSYKLWKVIGLGIEGGLRGNRQETLDYEINILGNEDANFDTIDNKLQSYFLAGISYKF